MTGGPERIEARIHEIEGLLSGGGAPNEEFSNVLKGASVAGVDPAGAGSLSPYRPEMIQAGIGGTLSPQELSGAIQAASTETGLSPDLLSAVISAESGNRNFESSSAGAQGLMQLMPQTAHSLGVSNPFDPVQNVMGGARYLRQQLDRFGSVEKALAAYNAGPGAVERYQGVPPFPETQQYVRKILGALGADKR